MLQFPIDNERVLSFDRSLVLWRCGGGARGGGYNLLELKVLHRSEARDGCA